MNNRKKDDVRLNAYRYWFWITAAFVALFSTIGVAQNVPSPRPLELGKPIEMELKGGEVHSYSINLTAGQFLHLIVDQRGIDVVVTLFGPNGKQIEEVDSPNGANGPEPLTLLARTSGPYRIEVRSLEKNARAGRYEVRIETLREATAEDQKIAAIKDFAMTLANVKTEDDGVALLAKNPDLITAELWKKLDLLGDSPKGPVFITNRLALRVAEQANHKLGIAASLNNLGVVYQRQGNLKQALDAFQKSLPLAEEVDDKGLRATVLLNIGDIQQRQGNLDQALENFQRVLKLDVQSKGTGVVTALNNIGNLHLQRGKYTDALESFNAALKRSEVLANSFLIARAHERIGWTNFVQGNYTQAIEHYQKSLSLRETLGSKYDLAYTLNNMSLAYRLQGNFTAALQQAKRALTISETLDNKGLAASIQMTMGLVYGSQGNASQALESYRRSLTLSEASGDKGMIANALEKIGGAHHSKGEIKEALEAYQKSLELDRELGDKRQTIFVINAIGSVYRTQGDYAKASEYFKQTLKLSQELGNKFQVATALNVLGVIKSDQGEYEQALEYFRRALAIREEIQQLAGVMSSLNNIGEIYRLQGDYPQAMDYYQKALALAEKIGSKGGMQAALNNIGETHRAQGHYALAMENLTKSLPLAEELGDRLGIPETLNSMAAVSLAQGENSRALGLALRATEMARQTGYREYLWRALTLSGKAYHALNQSEKALQVFDEAITTIEALRSTITGLETRASYFTIVREPYELYIDLWMQLRKEHPTERPSGAALQMSERSRARSLLETLSEAHADIRNGVNLELLEREHTLSQQLNATVDRQIKLLSGKHSDDQASSIKKEVDDLTAQFQEVEAEIRQKSPRYAALTQPTTLGLKGIQQLLDPNTLILEYSLGEEHSYLWVVGQSSIASFELPKRAEVENAVAQFVRDLTSRKPTIESDTETNALSDSAASLSRMLIAPAASQLGAKRLVIIADGALQYIPFAALPTPGRSTGRNENRRSKSAIDSANSSVFMGQPLIVKHEIVSLPSASTLAVLRREIEGRKPAPKMVAVFADPVFSKDDERVVKPSNLAKANPSPTETSSDATEEKRELEHPIEKAEELGLNIRRLPGTRREAETILSLVPKESEMKAFDFDANRAAITNAELSNYRYVHFATHGFLNTSNPELSGVVLSMINREGQPENGFLLSTDLFNLHLPAELVVLSACQTALGKEIRGEGMVGLTRGFMYAGAPRVIVSLWSVSDRATAELMTRLYQRILHDHLAPAAALRAAQLEMLRQKRWQSPYYWAAFVMQGEWR